jgi:hypothetical protein
MDPFDSNTWKQQWVAFWSAPVIIGPLLLIVASAVWWVRGRLFEAQVSGLKEQIAAMEQRLKLAADASTLSQRAKEELDKQFQAYRADVAAKGSNASPAKFAASLEEFKRENAIMSHALKVAQQAVENRAMPLGSGY